MNKLPSAKRVQVIGMMVEGMSIRAIVRLTGVSKTTILKQMVYSIERNNPEVHLMVLLVDERPEEVTDMKRHVVKGEVVALDRPAFDTNDVAPDGGRMIVVPSPPK